jgi:uncharacterized protein (TIGR02646 family)
MIRIDRPPVTPAQLGAGVGLVQTKIDAHDADPPLYTTLKGKFSFDAGVYGHADVRQILKEAQRGKCCFCESKFEDVSHGEIEHFRPKAAWRQSKETKLTRPGYYWLAYTWDNLLWSCKMCNGTHKKNLFPLEDPSLRDCVGRSVANEAPLLIDPSACDPREHIRFKLDKAIGVTDAGRITIDSLGLNREKLVESRRGWLQYLIAVWNNIDMARQLGRENQVVDGLRTLERAVLPQAPYSSMAIDLIAMLQEGQQAEAA